MTLLERVKALEKDLSDKRIEVAKQIKPLVDSEQFFAIMRRIKTDEQCRQFLDWLKDNKDKHQYLITQEAIYIVHPEYREEDEE